MIDIEIVPTAFSLRRDVRPTEVERSGTIEAPVVGMAPATAQARIGIVAGQNAIEAAEWTGYGRAPAKREQAGCSKQDPDFPHERLRVFPSESTYPLAGRAR